MKLREWLESRAKRRRRRHVELLLERLERDCEIAGEPVLAALIDYVRWIWRNEEENVAECVLQQLIAELQVQHQWPARVMPSALVTKARAKGGTVEN